MKFTKVSLIIDRIIGNLETEAEVAGRHVIKTETIKDRAIRLINIDGNNQDTDYLASVGFTQVIQSRLYAHGYRSVRKGRFVNLDRCEDIDYLISMLRNEETSIKDKEAILAVIKSRANAQISMKFNGSDFAGYTNPLTEEEFLARLEADSV